MISKTGIHVDENSSFTNPLVYEENGQVNHVVADNLTPETRYYTRGYVISDGTTVYSGNIKSFVTESPDYFTFSNPNNSSITVTLTKNGGANPISGETSLDDGQTWTAFNFSGVTSQTWTIPAGEKLKFRGNNSTFSTTNSKYYNFTCSSDINVSGNIMTLLDKNGLSTILPWYCFYNLFANMTKLDNFGLVMKAKNIGFYSCFGMFYQCSGLTNPPDFSYVETIGTDGLAWAFHGCSNLIDPPDLSNVITIGHEGLYCCFLSSGLVTAPDLNNVTSIGYSGMASAFNGCSALVEGPDLSNVTSVGNEALSSCFSACSSIYEVTAPNISDLTVDNILNNWLYNAGTSVPSGVTKVVNIPTGTTITPDSTSGIPIGWDKIEY